jgi:periplasmic divalent cation tolerance protein
MATTDIVLVLTTWPDDDDAAETLARALIDERLAACVNIHGPMLSVYRWKGAVERDTERQIVIKTTRDSVAHVEARVRASHPYDLPEFLVISADGSDAYLEWVRQGCREGD